MKIQVFRWIFSFRRAVLTNTRVVICGNAAETSKQNVTGTTY